MRSRLKNTDTEIFWCPEVLILQMHCFFLLLGKYSHFWYLKSIDTWNALIHLTLQMYWYFCYLKNFNTWQVLIPETHWYIWYLKTVLTLWYLNQIDTFETCNALILFDAWNVLILLTLETYWYTLDTFKYSYRILEGPQLPLKNNWTYIWYLHAKCQPSLDTPDFSTAFL